MRGPVSETRRHWGGGDLAEQPAGRELYNPRTPAPWLGLVP